MLPQIQGSKKTIIKLHKPFIDPATDPQCQSLSITQIVEKYTPWEWKEFFDFAAPELAAVSIVLDTIERDEGSYYPWKCDIFRAFYLTPPSGVKVIIFGQDPYYQTLKNTQEPRATGLSFSLRPHDTVTASLRNIYSELATTVKSFVPPDHGDLTPWTKQGIFLLNSCLTVKPNEPGSHKRIWMGFMAKLMSYLNDKNPGIVYVLWGMQAQNLRGDPINQNAKFVEAPHPVARDNSFLGSGTFREINRLVKSPIDWTL